MAVQTNPKVFGCLPDDTPPVGAMLSLGFQQFLTMFPFTVPYLFPNGIPAIVFAAIVGIFLNLIFVFIGTPEVRGE